MFIYIIKQHFSCKEDFFMKKGNKKDERYYASTCWYDNPSDDHKDVANHAYSKHDLPHPYGHRLHWRDCRVCLNGIASVRSYSGIEWILQRAWGYPEVGNSHFECSFSHCFQSIILLGWVNRMALCQLSLARKREFPFLYSYLGVLCLILMI